MTIPTPTPPNYLDDGAAAYAPTGGGAQTGFGQVGGAAASFNIGAGGTAWNGVVVVNVTAVDTSSGDEKYQLEIQGSTTSNFASTATLGLLTVAAPGQYEVPVAAFTAGVLYPYFRLAKHLTGTTPSITLSAFPLPFSGMDDLSLADLIKVNGLAAQNLTQVSASLLAWATGTANGGPNGDGRYVLSDAAGDSFLVLCPAAAALSAGGINALPVATGTEASFSVPVAAAGAVKRINFFPARRTADLTQLTALVGQELMPALDVGGIERKISLNALSTIITGFINPKLPPYNCKGNLLQAEDGVIQSNSAVFQSASGLFKLGDVGKLFFANVNSQLIATTIASVQSTNQVTLAQTVPTGASGCLFFWGTDDTAGMQAAWNASAGPGLRNFGLGVLIPSGNYLCGPLTYPARCVIKGQGGRATTLSRKPDSSGTAFITAVGPTVDYPIISDLAIDGLRFVMPVATDCLRYDGAAGSTVLDFGGPAPYFGRIYITAGSFRGLLHSGQGAGIFEDIQIDSCAFSGFSTNGFDMTLTNFVVSACGQTGIYFNDNASANNNLRNFYAYFNGAETTSATNDLTANLYLGGTGHDISGGRVQESYGDNIVIGGQRMTLSDVRIDDTGCIYPEHDKGTPTTATFTRAGVKLLKGATILNYMNNLRVGTAVHTRNFATHGIFLSGNCSNNRGSIISEPGQGWYNGGPGNNGQTVVPTTGPYAPGPFGTDSSGGVGATNAPLTVDGVQIG